MYIYTHTHTQCVTQRTTLLVLFRIHVRGCPSMTYITLPIYYTYNTTYITLPTCMFILVIQACTSV